MKTGSRQKYFSLPAAAAVMAAFFFFVAGESALLAQAPPDAKPADAAGYWARAQELFVELKEWKEQKNWEAVYDKGPGYKKEILADLDAAKRLNKDDADLAFRTALLRWEVVREDDADEAFGLFNEVLARAKDAAKSKESLVAIKGAADGLLRFEDKNLSRRLYEVYVGGLGAAGFSSQELKDQAQAFLAENNAYLAKTLFDMSFKTAGADPVVTALEMVAAADRFAHQDAVDGVDPVYAEELYQKASETVEAAWPAASVYRRAFNQERLRDYVPAIDGYKRFIESFPKDARAAEVYFRLGVLSAYAAKDIPAAQAYFARVKDDFSGTGLAVSALYQSGLLDQWSKDNEKARVSYDAALAAAQALAWDMNKNELVALLRQRLLEIDEGKEIQYGLRLFLEGTFGAGDGKSLPLQVDLVGHPAKAAAAAPVRYAVTTSNPQTGCMSPTYAYEWSGETGALSNIPNSVEITTDYPDQGLKVAHVAVLGTAGLEGAGFEIVEVNTV